MTKQRQVILEALQRSPGHLTGDEVYRRARRRLPHISLGTVYRNLDLLADAGIIRRLELGGTPRRFDANVEPHYHIRCLKCGKVEDIPASLKPELEQSAREASGYAVVAARVELFGYCPDCTQAGEGRTPRTRSRSERS